ncbi:MAG: DCC1-like thiol-disulfide oxidoreductase family protein [Bacteroidota bacterium]
MFKKIHKLVESSYFKRIDATGLAVFRISYSLVLLMEVIQLYYFRHLVFDTIPFLKPSELNFGPIIILWIGVILFIVMGLFTRTAAIINYLFTVLFFGLCSTFEYHMFYVYTGINFLIIFLPVSKVLSIDLLRVKLKFSNTKFFYKPGRTVTQLAYTIPLFLAVAFVYFDSTLFKLLSPMWLRGLGLWLPASMPLDVNVDASPLLNSEFVSKFLGYLTFVFELAFLFTFWFKKFRIPLLIVGVGLHLGIVILFAIPWFGLGVAAIYLLLIPAGYWKKWKRPEVKNQRLTFYYDNECPLCARTKIVIEHFDIRKRIRFLALQSHYQDQPAFKEISYDDILRDIYSTDEKGKVFKGFDTYIRVANEIPYLKPLSWLMRIPGIYHIGKSVYGFVARKRNTERCTEDNCGYTPPSIPADADKIKIMHGLSLADLKVRGITFGLVTLTIFQLIISLNSGVPSKTIRLVMGKENKDNFVRRFSLSVKSFTRPFLGITNHGVFMDHHLMNYNNLFAVTYVDPAGGERWLPMTLPSGMPGAYIYGSELIKWTFRVNNPEVEQQKVEEGIEKFSAFWAVKHGISLRNAQFKIKMKEIESTLVWQKDFLKKNIAGPWRDIGTAQWKEEQFTCAIENINGL